MAAARVGTSEVLPADRLASAVENAGVALLLIDAQGRTSHATAGLARVLGEPRAALVGLDRLGWWLGLSLDAGDERTVLDPALRPSLSAAAPSGADLLAVVQHLQEAQHSEKHPGTHPGVHLDVDVDLARADGQLLVAQVRLSPDGTGGVVLLVHDVTTDRAAAANLRTLLARQEAVIAASPDTIYRIHLGQSVVEWTNTGAGSLLGLPPVERDAPTAPVHPDDVPVVARAVQALRHAAPGEIVECTYRVLGGHGEESWVHTRSTVSDRTVAGAPLRVVGIAQDLTETITTMDALAGSERRFHEIFARGPVGMLLFGLEGWVHEVNVALCTFLERDPAELVGALAADVVDPVPSEAELAAGQDAQALADAQLSALVEGTEEVVHRERRYELPSGRVVWAQITVSLTSTSTGEPAFLAFVEDITARKREAEQLEHAALHDPLTGLPNRARAEDRLGTALARTQRRGGGCAVLFVDLDHFKEVNDTLGHAAGDTLLRDVADRLRSLLRAGDTAARIGGDEFVLVCEDVPDAQALAAIAARVCERITIPVDLGARTVTVTASVGAARTDGAAAADDLLRAADRAMYRAKAAGRACWRVD
ncbi:diguanylate cyclase domain-containing protein [Kineococcus rhizosphaerae]|uniref:PAS domain S-box-containing protein/diguanylate cyclase (GGDEF)-like protein n=1 Tax=Kineococcus rhizosphaerae TaxID=559628 RepID=A0A2T0RAM9_9ACTN|nr:diguanylate cyclase [Kineococcus rhizosphaerae]PRY18190.1 PAS domain S-box-containing protein/diguanylate cyclase (GGDEF)-like protein [Kineococcus rhizosphaerae]